MRIFIILAVLFVSVQAQAVLIDKIVAVVDDQVLTLGQIKRVRDTLQERKEILPQIFKNDSYTDLEIAQLLVESQVIKKSLLTLGYTVDDGEVEGRIKQLGVPKDALMNILESKGFKYVDYFEMIRTSIEYIIFYQQIISPLVSVTDQEIKGEFIKGESNSKTLSLKYNLISYSLRKDQLTDEEKSSFTGIVSNYRANKPISEKMLNIVVNELGEVREEGLSPEFHASLKQTEEGQLTSPIDYNDDLIVFFVAKKDIVESEYFQKIKGRIASRLFEERSEQISKNWINRESQKYYIKYFL